MSVISSGIVSISSGVTSTGLEVVQTGKILVGTIFSPSATTGALMRLNSSQVELSLCGLRSKAAQAPGMQIS